MNNDDDRPRPRPRHDIGQDLSLLSVEEIQERITLLREEIVRLEQDCVRKQASKAAADAFFKL